MDDRSFIIWQKTFKKLCAKHTKMAPKITPRLLGQNVGILEENLTEKCFCLFSSSAGDFPIEIEKQNFRKFSGREHGDIYT